MTTPIYDLPELTAGQDGAEVNHNEALRRIEMFGPTSIILSQAQNTPAVSPSDGDLYTVGTVPTGIWVGHANEFAGFANGWLFATIPTGQLASEVSSTLVLVWSGTAWVTVFDWTP